MDGIPFGLFGGFTQNDGGTKVPVRLQACFAHLVINQNARLSRVALLSTFFGHLDEQGQKSKMYDLVYQFKGLESSWYKIEADQDTIAIVSEKLLSDVHYFKTLIGGLTNNEDFQALSHLLIDLYSGHLLPEFDNTFIKLERSHLHSQISKVYLDLIKNHRVNNLLAQALDLTERYLKIDPLSGQFLKIALELCQKLGLGERGLLLFDTAFVFNEAKGRPPFEPDIIALFNDLKMGRRPRAVTVLPAESIYTQFYRSFWNLDHAACTELLGRIVEPDRSNVGQQIKVLMLQLLLQQYEEIARQADGLLLLAMSEHPSLQIQYQILVLCLKAIAISELQSGDEAARLIDKAKSKFQKFRSNPDLTRPESQSPYLGEVGVLCIMTLAELHCLFRVGRVREVLSNALQLLNKIADSTEFSDLDKKILDIKFCGHIGTTYYHNNYIKDSLRYIERAVHQLPEHKERLAHSILLTHSQILDQLGRFTESRPIIESVKNYWKTQPDRLKYAESLYNFAGHLITSSAPDLSEAYGSLETAIEMYTEAQMTGWVAACKTMLGFGLLFEKKFSDALVLFEQAIAIHDALGETVFTIENYAYSSFALLGLGKLALADQAVSKAIELSLGLPESAVPSDSWYVKYLVEKALGRSSYRTNLELAVTTVVKGLQGIYDPAVALGYLNRDHLMKGMIEAAIGEGLLGPLFEQFPLLRGISLLGGGKEASQDHEKSTKLRRSEIVGLLKLSKSVPIPSSKELAHRYGVSERTIERDIQFARTQK